MICEPIDNIPGAVNQSNSIIGFPTLAGLVNLAVRAGSGCPREGFKKARK